MTRRLSHHEKFYCCATITNANEKIRFCGCNRIFCHIFLLHQLMWFWFLQTSAAHLLESILKAAVMARLTYLLTYLLPLLTLIAWRKAIMKWSFQHLTAAFKSENIFGRLVIRISERLILHSNDCWLPPKYFKIWIFTCLNQFKPSPLNISWFTLASLVLELEVMLNFYQLS